MIVFFFNKVADELSKFLSRNKGPCQDPRKDPREDPRLQQEYNYTPYTR
jgi:hypothetical protein